MPSHAISTPYFGHVWPRQPTLVELSGHEAYWAGEGLEFCQTVLGYLPALRYDVSLSKNRDSAGVQYWLERAIAEFDTDADLVAFRLRFPEV